MDDLAAKEISRPRTALAVAGVFALMAIVLAAVGVYGVMSYEVSQRRRELAVRSALGASPDQIFRVVVGGSAIVGAGALLAIVVLAAYAPARRAGKADPVEALKAE